MGAAHGHVTALEDHDLLAWLGDGWTDAQAEQIIARWRAVEHLADGDDARKQLLTAIAQYVDGAADPLTDLAAADLAARRRADHARSVLRAAVIVAVSGGMSESEAARQAGVTRLTVRAWLGK